MDTLKEQYKLIISSREAVLNYCENITKEHLIKELDSFNNNSITYLLLHIANTYLFWLKNFTFIEEFEYFTGENIKDIYDLRNAFNEVNLLVDKFLNFFSDRNTPVEGEIFWLKRNQTETPLSLFTHVTTHEFHHKGQIMTMSRLLGYTPSDADIIRFE